MSCVKLVDPDTEANPSVWSAPVTGLSAVYQKEQRQVVLSWNPSTAADFLGYRIYRTRKTGADGAPTLSTLKTNNTISLVPRGTTTALDAPDIIDGSYFYGIRTVQLDGIDTVFGQLSTVVPCSVGVSVSFTINRTINETATRLCSLTIYDPEQRVESVRFTQVRRYFSMSSGTPSEVQFEDLYSYDVGDPYDQLKSFGKYNLVQISQSIDRSIYSVPDFDSIAYTENDALATMDMGGDIERTREWYLSEKLGKKTVFAEITYKNGGGRDTLSDLVYTKDHKIEVVSRMTTMGEAPEQKDTSVQISANSEEKEKRSYIYLNKFKFSIKIFADSTLDTDFDCWMMTMQNEDKIDNTTLTGTSERSFSTTPLNLNLTGRGVDHNSEYVYTFDMDTTTSNGRKVFEELFPSYWGSDDRLENWEMVYDTLTDSTDPGNPVVVIDSTKVPLSGQGAVGDNYRTFIEMAQSGYNDKGAKEVLFILRFKDTQFNDSLLFVYGYEGLEEISSLYLDVYPPQIKIGSSEKGPAFFNDGEVIDGPFSFSLLDTSGADRQPPIIDRGFGKIEEIKLVIARRPEHVSDLSTIALSDIYSERHYEYPFDITVVRSRYYNVVWDNIDPRDWPSGEYVLAVVVKDFYSEARLADVFEGNRVNPILVNIKSRY